MKNKKIKPTRSRFNVLRQICNLILGHEVSKIARTTGARDKTRTFSPWSHTVNPLNSIERLASDCFGSPSNRFSPDIS
jgi:hypothetical protein